MPPTDPRLGDDDAPDVAAAELALGLLDGEERATALRRVLAEPGFARDVERWRAHLSQLFDLWPAMQAPDVLARVERSIDHPVPVATLAAPAVRTSRLWPSVAVLSSLVAAILLVVLVIRPVPVPPTPLPRPAMPAPARITPTLVASISPTAKGAAVTVVFDERSGELRLTEAALADAARSAELWVIPAGDTVPHSLGLLRAHGATALKLSPGQRARIAAGATLAVSLEPIGGSPTGLPTGPVVASGALQHV